MKRLAGVCLGLMAMIPAAFAADMARPVYKAPPLVPVWSWTGFYVGGNAGGHWMRDDMSTSTTAANFAPLTFGPIFDAGSPGRASKSGFIGGVQLGANWQTGNLVLGVEADANWLSGSASRAITVFFGNMTNTSRISFLATARPRVGWAFDRGLLYATGGLAVGSVNASDTFGIPGNFFDQASTSATRVGWTVGGGYEYAFLNNWTVKAEYLYVDLGSVNVSLLCNTGACPGGPVDSVVRHRITDHIVRVGLNYKFN